MFKYDVAIIGGCGHVGLPLALSFANEYLKVLAVDVNEEVVYKVNNKEMPFREPSAQDILEKVIEKNYLHCTTDESKINQAEYNIIVPGTPVDFDFIPDLSQIERVVKSILPYLQKEQTLIFRSTLAPRSTDYIKNYVEKNSDFIIGEDIYLAFAPERLVQSDAIRELKVLPQIIGTYDDFTYKKVKMLFDKICPETIQTTPLEAELAKLFTNNYRYVNFALANELFMIADSHGANIFNILKAVNRNYPRANIPKPGFAKGPCLGKDAWILLSSVPSSYSYTGIISSAFRVNEGIPSYLIAEIKKKVNTLEAKTAVLGLTFKKDCDDTRDSLSMKLLKLLKNEFIEYETHDPFVDDKDLEQMLKGKNLVIIATNHSLYELTNISDYVDKGTLVVDIWNTQKRDQIFFTV